MTTAVRRSSRPIETAPAAMRRPRWLSAAVVAVLLTTVLTGVYLVTPLGGTADWLLRRLPATVAVTLLTTVVAVLLGLALAVPAAELGARFDRTLHVIVLVGQIIPATWIGLVLSTKLVNGMVILPSVEYTAMGESFSGWLTSIAAPLTALALASAAAISRQFEKSSQSLLDSDLVRTLRSRGLTGRHILQFHVFPRVFHSGLTPASLHFVAVLIGMLFIEFVMSGRADRSSAIPLPDVPPAVIPIVAFVLVAFAMYLAATPLASLLRTWQGRQ